LAPGKEKASVGWGWGGGTGVKLHWFKNDKGAVTADFTGANGEWRVGFSDKKNQSLRNPCLTKQSTPTGTNTSTPGAKALPAPSPLRDRS